MITKAQHFITVTVKEHDWYIPNKQWFVQNHQQKH